MSPTPSRHTSLHGSPSQRSQEILKIFTKTDTETKAMEVSPSTTIQEIVLQIFPGIERGHTEQSFYVIVNGRIYKHNTVLATTHMQNNDTIQIVAKGKGGSDKERPISEYSQEELEEYLEELSVDVARVQKDTEKKRKELAMIKKKNESREAL